MVPREINFEPKASSSPKKEVKQAPSMSDEIEGEKSPADMASRGVLDDEESADKIRDLAAEDDNVETAQKIRNKILYAQHDVLGQQALEEERTRGDLRIRSKQAILHLTYTELRITDLENQLRNLKAEIRNLPDDFKLSEKKNQCPVYNPVLKRSGPEEFRTTTNSQFVPIDQRPALEVLYTDWIPPYGGGDSEEPQKLTRRTTASLTFDKNYLGVPSIPERLRIRSWALIGHLQGVCREDLSSYKTFASKELESAPMVILRPFKLFTAYDQEIRDSIEDIERLANEQADKGNNATKGIFNDTEYEYKNLLQDLRLLIKFLDEDLKPTYELRRAICDGSAAEIEYGDLWHLFKLGDVVVTKSNRAQAFKVVNFTGGREPLTARMFDEKDRTPPVDGFAVDCCSVQFDGSEYVPKLHKFSIRKFNGRRPIRSLEVYPLEFDSESDALREELLCQGRQYLEMTRPAFRHRMFRGRTIDESPQELEAQVIIDIAMAVNANSEWRLNRRRIEDELTTPDLRETQMRALCEHTVEGCCGSDYIVKDLKLNSVVYDPFRRDYGGLFAPRTADELKGDIILLPNWVHGFVLRLRQWVTLKMVDLFEVPFENDFSELMISERHKKTLLAMVQTHEAASTTSSAGVQSGQSVGSTLDLVKGKGAGLILLLHGPPGVGKTSTAECVADKTRRPLFPITCGDIGETAMEVERNLHHNFRLAHRWGCVLLLDEADVFLAKRNRIDLRRNAVTSVFLRSLEYYAGILFLTTNRVGGIDPAFKSRIHLSVYYPRLDLETTLKLYNVFLRRTKEEQKRSGVTLFQMRNKEILHFAKRHYRELKKDGYNSWNGRQIRNAFQTAIALTEHQAAQNSPGTPKPVLGKEQFKIVAEGSREFDSYLIRTLQGADDEIAIRDQWRDDGFGGGTPATSLSATKSSQKASRGEAQREKAVQSDESLSETESESEDDTEGDDEADSGDEKGDSVAVNKDEIKGGSDGTFNFEEYEEFLKFKAMLKTKGK